MRNTKPNSESSKGQAKSLRVQRLGPSPIPVIFTQAPQGKQINVDNIFSNVELLFFFFFKS